MTQRKRYARKRKAMFIRTAAILVPMIAVLLLLSQTAFAKTTYVINDGTKVFTYTTFATDPEIVLDEAGLQLDEYDTYTTEGGLGSTTLTVYRSQTICIDHNGEQMEVESPGETVGELLARLNIFPDETSVLSASMDAQTYDGMELRISSVIREEQTYTAAISHGVEYCYDDSLPEGMEKVLTEGKDGEMRCTAMVTYVNGEETGREVTSQVVTVNPVDEVISVGTGLRSAGEGEAQVIIGDDTITLPTGEVLTYTHTSQVRASAYTHTDAGCDFITSTGTRVRIGTVAVDPRYIPYGTRMFIVCNDGSYVYGISVAEDCGGAIKGDRVDLYFPTYSECMQFGRRNCTVYFLG